MANTITHNKYDSDDILNEVMLKLISGNYKKNDINNMQSWVIVVTKHMAYDYLRKNYKFKTISLTAILKAADFTHKSEVKILANNVLEDLHNKNRNWYDCIVMKYMLEMSAKEIAKKLHLTEKQVDGYIYRATKYLNGKYRNEDSAHRDALLFSVTFIIVSNGIISAIGTIYYKI